MKRRALVLSFVLLIASLAWAQGAPSSPPPQGRPQGAPPQGGPGGAEPGAGPNSQRRAARRAEMEKRRAEHMEMMKAQVARMNAKLDEMKAAAARITDPNSQKAAQLDIDMWQMVADHFNMMMKHMEESGPMGPHGPGMAGRMDHMHDGMDCCQKMANGEMPDCCKAGKCGKDAGGKMACGGSKPSADSMSGTIDDKK